MPKIILNDKRMFGREKPFKIQINGEKKGLNLERKQELEVNNGECELRIFESFFMVKSPKVKLEVSDKKLELDLNYNYILLSIIGLLHVLVVLLVYLSCLILQQLYIKRICRTSFDACFVVLLSFLFVLH